jgi:hypothetical protein
MSAFQASRRSALGASLAVLLGGKVTQASAEHPDAELIELCRRHKVNRIAFIMDERDCDENPHWEPYLATENAISEAEPVTMAGVIAKAKAAIHEATCLRTGDQDWGDCTAAEWAADIVYDLLRLHGEDVA